MAGLPEGVAAVGPESLTHEDSGLFFVDDSPRAGVFVGWGIDLGCRILQPPSVTPPILP
jgi:hypothetical protein